VVTIGGYLTGTRGLHDGQHRPEPIVAEHHVAGDIDRADKRGGTSVMSILT
jgi:hypothetical protein